MLQNWLGAGSSAIDAQARAARAWARIQRDPTEITIRRNGAELDQQVVRIESDNSATTKEGVNTTVGWVRVTVFGIRDHAALPDTDIERGDQFTIDGFRYQVMALLTPPGEVQAVCEANSAGSARA